MGQIVGIILLLAVVFVGYYLLVWGLENGESTAEIGNIADNSARLAEQVAVGESTINMGNTVVLGFVFVAIMFVFCGAILVFTKINKS